MLTTLTAGTKDRIAVTLVEALAVAVSTQKMGVERNSGHRKRYDAINYGGLILQC